MDNKKIRDLIDQLKYEAPTKEVQSLIADFETYLDLSEQKKQGSNTNELFQKSQDKCFTSLDKALASLGFSQDLLQEYFENPSNFSKREWEEIEEMKTAIGKSRKKNNKLKIPKTRI